MFIKDSYTNKIELYLDNRINTGDYLVVLNVDIQKSIFCPFPEGIKNSERNLNIQRAIPTWSLNLHSVSLQQSISPDRTRVINRINISYNISIALLGQLAESLFWSDSYFISDRSRFDANFAIRLGETSQTLDGNVPNKLEYSMSVNTSFELAENNALFGTLYVYTFIDESEINLKLRMFDFPISKQISVAKIIPTLNLTQFAVKTSSNYDTTSVGYLVPLNLKIKNIGPLALFSKPTFSIYVKSKQTSTKISEIELEPPILVDQIDEVNTLLEIPKSYFGNLEISIRQNEAFDYVFISTILQTISAANNNSIIIEQPSSANLAIKHLSYTIKYESYRNTSSKCNKNLIVVDAFYTVENIGLTMNEVGVWNDRVEISCEGIYIIIQSI